MPQMTRLTSKGIYIVKIQNHPCTIMPPKSEIMRRGGYKCGTPEMNSQLREQQLKTISYTYRLLHQNFRIAANQKSMIDSLTRKTTQNTTLKIVIKPEEERTREKGKKKGQQEQIQSN